MRKYPTDIRLWSSISWSVFLSIGIFWAIMEGFQSVMFFDVVAVGIACAVLGWLAQAIVAICRTPKLTPEASSLNEPPPVE
jgi:hypothetical protein